jgi:hypothetical protein
LSRHWPHKTASCGGNTGSSRIIWITGGEVSIFSRLGGGKGGGKEERGERRREGGEGREEEGWRRGERGGGEREVERSEKTGS